MNQKHYIVRIHDVKKISNNIDTYSEAEASISNTSNIENTGIMSSIWASSHSDKGHIYTSGGCKNSSTFLSDPDWGRWISLCPFGELSSPTCTRKCPNSLFMRTYRWNHIQHTRSVWAKCEDCGRSFICLSRWSRLRISRGKFAEEHELS